MMKSFKILLLALIMSVSLSGCFEFAYIPPANKGKILTTNGYTPEILPPGKYFLLGRDDMVLLQTNTNTYTESVMVILADKLKLHVNVRFRGRLNGDDNITNSMFNDVLVGEDFSVNFADAYRIYGQMVVENQTRGIISQYTVEDVHKNYRRLSNEVGKAITEALKGTPIEVSDVTLGQIEYPLLVTKAIEEAKERDLSIKKEEAQAKIDLTRKKNERLLEEANYQIKITKAKAIRDSNKIIGEGITDALLKLRALEVQEKMAENKSAVFMPYEAFSSSGAQVRMYK